MKQFIVDRHTTPNTPTLEQVPTEKIPIYENRAAVEADLANLADGQIGATADTGSELSAPTDTVQSGNMHAVTSNAVAETIKDVEINYINVTGTTDSGGNYRITNLPNKTIALVYASTSQGTDVNYNLFFSSLAQVWHIHASYFDSGAKVAGATISGRVYYAKYIDD